MEQNQENKRAIPVQITVLRGNKLRGSRGKSCLSFVRVEFNGSVLGDSQRLDVSAGESVPYSFTCSLDPAAEHTLNDLAHKPLILTVIEILPKEQKEEKTAVLGQAVVDLLPLLQGQRSFSSTVQLHAVVRSQTDVSLHEGNETPTLDVTVSVPEPLLSDAQISDSNVLTVTVETAYSVPDVWNPASAPPVSFVAALQIPLSAGGEQVLLFSNGTLKMGGEREPVPRPKKWPLGPLLAPGAEVMQGHFIDAEPSDLDHGDIIGNKDRDFRAEAELNRKRVSWDTVCRCFIDAEGVTRMTRKIVRYGLWPVEIMRSPQTGATKGGKAGKDKGEDDTQISFHGVVYVDLAPLLYPGVRCIRGAYRIHPFYESDVLCKSQRTFSVLKEFSRSPSAVGRAQARSSAQSRTFELQKGNNNASKKPGSQEQPAQADSMAEMEAQVNTEGQMYEDSQSYIILEFAFEKPLVAKRPAEEPVERVRELIPPRSPLPESAVHEYHSQIESVTAQVLDQYQQLFGAAFAPGGKPLDPVMETQRKAQLLGELNYSGKYFAFKEQMKHSVVRIAREKMKSEAFSSPEQLQAFLSQLYVFLVDEMHVALNKTLSVDSQESHHESSLSSSQLKHFAKEAELNSDHQQAAQYYQERLTRDRSDPSHWFDYGAFFMRIADHLKAKECFQQALSADQSHIASLLMCGALSEMNECYEDAKTFFERATSVDPSNVVAWTVLGLFYQSQDKSTQAEMTFLEAKKQLNSVLQGSSASRTEITCETQTGAKKEQKKNPVNENPTDKTENTGGDTDGDAHISPNRVKTSIYMESAHFLLQNSAFQMAQRALAQQLLCSGPSGSYHLALAQLHLLREEYDSAEASLKEALSDNFKNPDIWALWGHLHYMRGDYVQAQSCYERTLDSVLEASDPHAVYLRLGSIYLQEGEYEKAKPTFLRACKSSPSCLTWLGLGVSYYRLEELTEAGEALVEATALNNMNPEVWGFLCLVYLQTGRKHKAEQSFKNAIKMNLQKESLLQEITELQARAGCGKLSF